MTYNAGTLNGRPDSQHKAPLAPVGVYWDCRYAPNIVSRGNAFIRLNPTPAEYAKGVRRSWPEFWDGPFNAKLAWTCGNGYERNGIFCFESPQGEIGAYRRFQTIDEYLRARKYGTPWLVDGFDQGAARVVDLGCELIKHGGCPDEGRWAADLLAAGNRASKAELLKTIFDYDWPLVQYGITIGHDYLSTFGPGTVSYARWDMLRLIEAPQQMEGSFGPDQVEHYLGAKIFQHYAAFMRYHVEQDANVIASGMPAVGSPNFEAWYAEMRVVLPYDVCQADVPADLFGWSREYLEKCADRTRELLAMSPKIRVLLDEWIVGGCLEVGVPIERFLPEGN